MLTAVSDWSLCCEPSAVRLWLVVVVGRQHRAVAGGDRAIELAQPQQAGRPYRTNVGLRYWGDRDRPRDVRVGQSPSQSRGVGIRDRDLVVLRLGARHRIRDLSR